jgi:hydroxyacylglutathione hydrolase
MKIKRFEFNMFPENCYVLSDDEGHAVIIDPGCYYPEEDEMLKNYIIGEHLTVDHLLLTHLHPDHIFGTAFLYKEFGLKGEANQGDESWYENAPQHSRQFGIEMKEPPAPLLKYLDDGEMVTFGNTSLECILVPGHSPGSLVYYQKESDCIFSGDVLFRGSMGRADLAGGNFDMLHQAILDRLFVLPDNTVVYPGHGETTTIGDEKVHNPFFI